MESGTNQTVKQLNSCINDRFLETFTSYIDSGSGLLGTEVAFLSSTLITIDMVLAGLLLAWGADEDVIPRLVKRRSISSGTSGLSGILCGGPVSSVEEPLAKDDGELCLCLDPFPRRPFPLLGRVVKNEI
ncbi:hypothetical protein ACVMB3_007069 [Sinorhizobium meliloti]